MNIAGVIKDWMLIFFSFYLFHAPVTRLNLAGYAFCCTGVAIYNYQKLQVGAAGAAAHEDDSHLLRALVWCAWFCRGGLRAH